MCSGGNRKFFLWCHFFMDLPVFSNPKSNFLDRFGSSRVKSHNKIKYHSTMSLNKNS
ncbi:hypothetical protein Hanom_Chr04g00360441 [Helianthus anomalus]